MILSQIKCNLERKDDDIISFLKKHQENYREFDSRYEHVFDHLISDYEKENKMENIEERIQRVEDQLECHLRKYFMDQCKKRKKERMTQQKKRGRPKKLKNVAKETLARLNPSSNEKVDKEKESSSRVQAWS